MKLPPPITRRLITRLALATVSFFLAAAGAECLARYVFGLSPADLTLSTHPWMEIGPEGPRMKPDTNLRIRARLNGAAIPLRINSLGLRGPRISGVKPRGVQRILFLGDSVVFGPGLAENETVPYRLGLRLGGRVEVVNAGVPGMSLKDEAGLLEEIVEKADPDHVLLGFYLNDSVRSIILTEEYGDLGDFWAGTVTRGRKTSAVFNRAWEGWLSRRLVKTYKLNEEWGRLFEEGEWRNDRAAYDRIVKLASDDFGAAWRDDSWPAIEKEMGRLKKICEENGAGLSVVVFPVSVQAYSRVGDDLPQRRVRTIAAKLGLPMFDLLPAIKQARDQPIFYDQCHFTPMGADLAATSMAPWLDVTLRLEEKHE